MNAVEDHQAVIADVEFPEQRSIEATRGAMKFVFNKSSLGRVGLQVQLQMCDVEISNALAPSAGCSSS